MSKLLKDIYSNEFFDKFSDTVKEVIPTFDKAYFLTLIFDTSWNNRELKSRMIHTSTVLNNFFSKDFETATHQIVKIISRLKEKNNLENSIEYMFFPEYISAYGLEYFDVSIKSFEVITQFTSCEFAVRPFILKYPEKMIAQMIIWSKHPNNKVRRLASEGSRPRLPWAIALPNLKTNPTPIFPILENLKDDSCEVVRRSVANNLNDISKDNKGIVIEIVKKWKGYNNNVDKVLKHACRTLLKQGDVEILTSFKIDNKLNISISDFKISSSKLRIGDDLEFSFLLQNNDNKTNKIRIEYGIYYLRQNGNQSKKVFAIAEKEFLPHDKLKISKKQSFRIITTRKFYAGNQKLAIIANGNEILITDFELFE